MSKERELLESAIEYLYDLQGAWLWKENEVAGNGEEYNDLDNLVVKIREHLSQPDQGPKSSREFYQEGYAQAERDLKRKPLSNKEIEELWGDPYSGSTKFVRNFVSAINQRYGIGE